MYSDGVTEAATTRAVLRRATPRRAHRARRGAQLSAPETLRRLAAAVLEHQQGKLQDDATLLLVDWSADSHVRMFPTLSPADTVCTSQPRK